ncbi:MAG TPA: RNA polymerase sigma factor [Polyangiaceae bacterium]
MSQPRVARAQLSVVRTPGPTLQSRVVQSDSALVAGGLIGDRRSKQEIYLRHVDYIAGMCARLLRSIEASEDVVQDTFVIAFSKIGLLREPAAFRGWLAAIAVHQVHRRLARQRLLRFFGLDLGLDDAPLDECAREDLTVEARSELAALDLVLQELPTRQRIAWMLRHVEGEPLDAVAEACGCSRATVKRWIALANARIKEHVRIVAEEDPS